MGGGYMPGQAGTTLGYEYEPPRGGYDADAGWNGWELARAQYGGGSRRGTQGRGFERDWFDGIINSVASYFTNRRLTESQAREAHRRVYHLQEPERCGFDDITARTLGGAAAFQAFLIWDRDHRSVYSHHPSENNRERLISMAVGEAYSLFERLGLHKHSTSVTGRNLTLEDCAETAAATAKYIFEHQYRDAEDYHSEVATGREEQRRRRGKQHRRTRSSGSSSSGNERGNGSHHHPRHSQRSRHHQHHHDSPSDYSAHHHHHHHQRHHSQHAPYPQSHVEHEMAAYRGGGIAAPGIMPGMAPAGGHLPPSMHRTPGIMGATGASMGMMPGMQMSGMGMQNPMMYGSHPGMMQQQGMGMGMGLGMMGPGVMGMGGQGGIAYPPSAGQMMENQMLAQHQAMHGQAVPGMSPEFAHRMDGEGPIPGTKQYTDALAYSGGGGGMQGQGYPLVGQMGGSGQHGYGYGGGMGGAGMYGQPRGSWYGR